MNGMLIGLAMIAVLALIQKIIVLIYEEIQRYLPVVKSHRTFATILAKMIRLSNKKDIL